MVRPPADFVALHRIPDSGPAAYQRGDDVAADAVERWGLVVGEDVIPARPDVLPRPAGNAPRSEWEAYALGRGVSRDELDALTVADIRGRFPDADDDEPEAVRLDDYPDRLRPVDLAVVTEQGRRLPVPTDAPTAPTDEAAVASGVDAVNVPDDQPRGSVRPAAGAKRADWEAYAREQGADDAWIADHTVDEIKAEFPE
jgi:hypothetical protein